MWIISFDLYTEEAKNIKAYSEISFKLVKNFFKRIQGSCYISDLGLSNLHKAINAVKSIDGIEKCIKDFRVFQVPMDSDFTDLMKEEKQESLSGCKKSKNKKKKKIK